MILIHPLQRHTEDLWQTCKVNMQMLGTSYDLNLLKKKIEIKKHKKSINEY